MIKVKFLDLHSQYLTIKKNIDLAIESVISKSSYIGGSHVVEFESQFSRYQSANHCIGVGNGTDALEIAIEALELEPSSEIIVPANSFIASSEAVTRAGHKVVFADIDPVRYTISLDDVLKKISNKTRAVIAVHLYGNPCDLDGLLELAKVKSLKIIEDCAQAHGAEIKGKKIGALGDVGAFSFYPGKNLGAYGDAGAVLTNDNDLAVKIRMIANHGRIDKYNHKIEGRNSRLDGLQAAILNVKLLHLDKWLNHRKKIAGIYLSGLSGVSSIVLPFIDDDVRHAFHLFVIRVSDRDELIKFLSEKGVETGIHYPIALPKLAAYRHLYSGDTTPIANSQDESLLSLPIGDHLKEEQARYVVEMVKVFYGY
jgi:dTDP-4-amino-4,6-dideoxygalactose transaminase